MKATDRQGIHERETCGLRFRAFGSLSQKHSFNRQAVACEHNGGLKHCEHEMLIMPYDVG